MAAVARTAVTMAAYVGNLPDPRADRIAAEGSARDQIKQVLLVRICLTRSAECKAMWFTVALDLERQNTHGE